MLLIGSRAIIHHFPDFRPPRDWDLVADSAEIDALSQRLPPMPGKPWREHKAFFRYDGSMVEVVNIDVIPYWAKVHASFRDEPSIDDPVLGRLVVAPPAFLMVTKQCGLVYDILHWHKNLEDLYFLRARIDTVPDSVAELLPHALADSRNMFAATTNRLARAPDSCHAEEGPARPRTALHAELHGRLCLGSAPMISIASAWQGFPESDPKSRREQMIRLFAEETMVVAAEQSLTLGLGPATRDERALARWALRMLITSRLPEGLRYFAVNHYREIRERIPAGWLARTTELRDRYPRPNPCGEPREPFCIGAARDGHDCAAPSVAPAGLAGATPCS